MNKLSFIRLIAKTERPEHVDGAKWGTACRDAVEYAFSHWVGDNGQDHAKNASLIDATVKMRDGFYNVHG